MAVEEKVHAYLLTYSTIAMENTPTILEKLLGGYAANDPVWDTRPSPERFNLREAIAHIADWNHIYSERIKTTLGEDNPLLPNCDENQIAIDRKYASSNPVDNLGRFVRTRHELVDLVKGLKASDFDRMAMREGLGPVRLDQQIAIIMGHDAYHVRQVMDYLGD